jgi:DNA-binding transcriptional LysR family regulator
VGAHEGRLEPGARRPPPGSAEPVARLTWAVYAREGHPAIEDWGLAAWASHPHLRVRTASEGESPVERAARAAGVVRRGGPYLPHLMLAPPILAATDCLMTVPRQVLAGVARSFALVALECPVALEPVPLSLVWSAARSNEPAVAWIRGLVREVVQRAFAEAASGPPGARRRRGRARRRGA